MAIYHFSVKTISRSEGRSATASAAYRAAEKITDEQTGEIHDYTKKQGVIDTGIILPEDAPEWAKDRAKLWNEAERAEKRKNSTVAREIIIALPAELNAAQQKELTESLARAVCARHRCAVDFAIHEPNREGDDRNHHAHLLLSTRRLPQEGFTEKTRELDQRNSGEVPYWRKEWEHLANNALERAGIDARVDHRTLSEQGISREATKHQGVAATAIQRRDKRAVQKARTPEPIQVSESFNALSPERLQQSRAITDEAIRTAVDIQVLEIQKEGHQLGIVGLSEKLMQCQRASTATAIEQWAMHSEKYKAEQQKQVAAEKEIKALKNQKEQLKNLYGQHTRQNNKAVLWLKEKTGLDTTRHQIEAEFNHIRDKALPFAEQAFSEQQKKTEITKENAMKERKAHVSILAAGYVAVAKDIPLSEWTSATHEALNPLHPRVKADALEKLNKTPADKQKTVCAELIAAAQPDGQLQRESQQRIRQDVRQDQSYSQGIGR